MDLTTTYIPHMDLTTTYIPITCGGCGVQFAMTEAYYDKRVADHKTWTCPNGCVRHYSGKSEAEKLRDQLARTTAQLDQERACCREKSAKLNQLGEKLTKTRAGYRGQLAKQKRKITAD